MQPRCMKRNASREADSSGSRDNAQRRMDKRNARRPDVVSAILTATSATYQEGRDNWRLRGGHDRDGDAMTVIVAFVAGLLVVTMF